MRGWINEVRERADENVVVGIVGNKCDLNKRSVSRPEAEDLANQNQAFYLETSVHDVESLRNAFKRMAQGTDSNRLEIHRTARAKTLEFSRGHVSLGKKTGDSEGCAC